MGTGYRSVEIIVINDTRGDLSVTGPVAGQGSTWIQGETPNQGDPLDQYQSAKWGVSTNDVNGNVSATVQLTGLGSYPLTLQFYNYSSGQTGAPCTGNDAVTPVVTQNPVVEQNHTSFQIQLVPNAATRWAS